MLTIYYLYNFQSYLLLLEVTCTKEHDSKRLA
jgi:hypothetical protein